jgi:PAS domain S-box-containing protein
LGDIRVPRVEGQALISTSASAEPPEPIALDLEDFFENGGIALHLVGADGTVLHANKAELELLGYSAEEYIGRSIADFHADRHVIDDILLRLGRGEKLRKYPARLRARDGAIKCVEITSNARFRDGEFINTRCFTVDLTELEFARQEIRRKDDLFRQVLEALPAAVYTTDAAGKLTYYNRAAAKLAGREPELGKDEWCVTFRLFQLDGTEMPHDQCPMAIALKENRAVRGEEALAQRPNGTMFPFLPFPTPIHDGNGEMVGAVNMLVDISERKQAETNQRMLLNELSHRVKNNMQMLYSLLRSAQRESKNAEAQAVLADASQRVGAMAAAQRLLYSNSNPRSFSIHEFLHAVCGSAQQAFGKGITVRIACDRGHLSNDVSMPLALILNELLTNAAKHGIDRSGTGEIGVTLRRHEGQMRLCVEDAGPGFDLHETGRLSSGLGLIRGLARQLGGNFTVERRTGARCTVCFPEGRAPGALARGRAPTGKHAVRAVR